MGDAKVNQINFSVTAPKVPDMPELPQVPKGNWAKFSARSERFFDKTPFKVVFSLVSWAILFFCAVTIYHVTAMDYIPSLSPSVSPISQSLPRFRQGNLHTQQGQMHLDTFEEKHAIQVYLILSVVFMGPLAVMTITQYNKFFYNGADYADSSISDKQTFNARIQTLWFAGFINWIVGQVFYFRCVPSNTCYDAPYKIVAGIWIYAGYAALILEFLGVVMVAFCVSDEEAAAPLLDGEEKDE